ncbi:TPA: DNA polymerase III subunit delta' [Morganella morganii]|nr:DNA polymerase III subunit delta' [Morganella morganii]
MNWYPWLNPVYRQLATAWLSGQGHHALLLYGISGTGTDELAYALTRLRMCQQPQGIKSCGECHSCKLMLAGTHPDFYLLQPEKGKSAIGIDAVRAVTEKLYDHAQQGGAKLVHIPQAELLTEAAANALLKTLEEPTENTWFVLQSRGAEQLLPTLRSRCFAYHLAPPSADTGVQWLQREYPQSDAVSRQTALNLCHNAPAAALSLLTTADWQNRLNLFTQLAASVRSGDFLSLLSELNHQDAEKRISWLTTLFMDAVKYQQNMAPACLNQDQSALVAQLATHYSSAYLLNAAESWLTCRHRLMTITGVNQELLLTEQLLHQETLFSASPNLR